MPMKNLASPYTPGFATSYGVIPPGPAAPVGTTNSDNVYTPSSPNGIGLNNDPTNFVLPIPRFLTGVVSAAIQSGSHPLSQVVVEVELFPGDWGPMRLLDPVETPGDPNEGIQFIEGPMKAGWGRVNASSNVRIRRIDQNGGVCNAYLEYRSGAY